MWSSYGRDDYGQPPWTNILNLESHYNQSINLEIIGDEDKNKIYIYIYIYILNLTKFLQFSGERERERERERIFNCEEIRFLIILGIIRKEELTLDVCLSKTKWDQDPLHFLWNGEASSSRWRLTPQLSTLKNWTHHLKCVHHT